MATTTTIQHHSTHPKTHPVPLHHYTQQLNHQPPPNGMGARTTAGFETHLRLKPPTWYFFFTFFPALLIYYYWTTNNNKWPPPPLHTNLDDKQWNWDVPPNNVNRGPRLVLWCVSSFGESFYESFYDSFFLSLLMTLGWRDTSWVIEEKKEITKVIHR